MSTKTIRYYEDIGLLPAPVRLPSGYRDYDASALDPLAFIRAAQAVGLSLGEIRSVVALRHHGETPCGYVVDLLRARSAELDRRIAELRALRGELRRLVERAEDLDPANCDPGRICHLIGPARVEATLRPAVPKRSAGGSVHPEPPVAVGRRNSWRARSWPGWMSISRA